MSALAFQLQGLVSGCCCVSWCFTCDQTWITLTGLWPLCTRVALGPFLCIEHSKQLLKSTFSYNSHKRTALSVQKKKKTSELTWPRGTSLVPDEEHSALQRPVHSQPHPTPGSRHSPSAWASTALHWGHSAFYTTQDISMSQHLWVLSGAGPIWISLLAVLNSIVQVFPQLWVIQHKLLK